ncbi:MAG: adenylyltransferase/cytidyltransferase family protein [Spirochaetales bacterium]|nr:adenylyltransferase/cytidyltransferase family protein [Spirochaetales bacterium]
MTGVIIGRFMPPHSGHLYLIDFARHMVDRLYVLVCTLSGEPIPGNLRYEWIRELAPSCKVIHITEEIPEARRGEAGATAIWAETVREAVSETITHVFASEQYGWELARHLDAQYVPVDPGRSNIPVSATAIRDNPWGKWRFIPSVVRPWFVRHIAVVDNREYAERTAREMNTVVVHPYREFWHKTWNGYAGSDKRQPLTEEQIRRGALSTTVALARRANRVLFHDLRGVVDLYDLPRIDLIVVDEGRLTAQDREAVATRTNGTEAAIMSPHTATAATIEHTLLAPI